MIKLLYFVVGCTFLYRPSYKVVQMYPHDTRAFTQGLVYDGGFLYESTGQRGESVLRKVELETGKEVQRVSLASQYFGEGMTIFEDRIIQLTWQSRVGFIYEKESFKKIGEFPYETEGWGLTHNGTELILSDGSSILYFMDPYSFQITRKLQVFDGDQPLRYLNELEYINDEIYANVYLSDLIIRIDPYSGTVLKKYNLKGLLPESEQTKDTDVLNGIAYDREKKRLFLTGKRWPKVFEVELID